jgi:hypothetical protein
MTTTFITRNVVAAHAGYMDQGASLAVGRAVDL